MKRTLSFIFSLCITIYAMGQAFPLNYGGVMLQGFYWDSFEETQWNKLESQADEFAGYFDMIWVPQSGKCLETWNTMGYTPYYYFNHNSSFGTEQQLRSMIATFKQKGIDTMADVVINHHNTTGWFGFPAEEYKGVTYQLQSTDIVANDDNGKAAAQAAKEGVSLSPNNDEGENWDGMRDLDHKSPNVQNIMRVYAKYLVDDLGYAGFRYDMVKGFHGSHVADYNQAAGVKYSVGEYWDSNYNIQQWIKSTAYASAAFDFQFKYNIRDAVDAGDWSKLYSTNNLMHDPAFRQYAVTFTENHDTQVRADGTSSGPLRKDTLAANAYMLAMPGTPCVFLKHYMAYPSEIKAMIAARKLAGITNMSNYINMRSGRDNYSNQVDGTRGKLIFVVGNTENFVPSASQYTKVLSGHHYAYYLTNAINSAWVDKPGGTYDGAISVMLTAITDQQGVKLVYTTDGSEPTASSTQVASGTKLDLPAGGTTVLKVGLLINGVVTGVVSHTYKLIDFKPYSLKVYVNADEADAAWGAAKMTATQPMINFWIWGGTHKTTKGSWPGDVITATETVNGMRWLVKSFDITHSADFVNLVLSVGNGSPQTVNIENIKEDTFIRISSEKEGNNNKVNVATTAIEKTMLENHAAKADPYYYTLSGQRMAQPNKPGIYIYQGRKLIIK